MAAKFLTRVFIIGKRGLNSLNYAKGCFMLHVAFCKMMQIEVRTASGELPIHKWVLRPRSEPDQLKNCCSAVYQAKKTMKNDYDPMII